MRILVIDDLRTVSEAYSIAKNRSKWYSENCHDMDSFVLINNFEDARKEFEKDTIFDVLLLDHDLGSANVYNDGTALLKILEERKFLEGFKKFSKIIPVSSNPVGIQRIREISERLEK